MSSKQDIQSAVRAILEKEESPLETAFKYEVANYEQSLTELRVMHRNNLWQLLDAYQKRGIEASDIEARIKDRLGKI